MLASAKAKAAGVASEVIQPKPFRQIIKASGEVQAAQGNESTIVANVSGIVSFQRSVTEGMQVGKGVTLMTISASKLQDGDPAERARIAYEAAKADFERASRLVESQIVSQKEFNAIKEKYENAKLVLDNVVATATGGAWGIHVENGGANVYCATYDLRYVEITAVGWTIGSSSNGNAKMTLDHCALKSTSNYVFRQYGTSEITVSNSTLENAGTKETIYVPVSSVNSTVMRKK